MGDPEEHVDKFYAKADFFNISNVAFCKVFRTTLSKKALSWFNQLPSGMIDSLKTFFYQVHEPVLHQPKVSQDHELLVPNWSKGGRAARYDSRLAKPASPYQVSFAQPVQPHAIGSISP